MIPPISLSVVLVSATTSLLFLLCGMENGRHSCLLKKGYVGPFHGEEVTVRGRAGWEGIQENS